MTECPACREQRLHTEEDWKNHPYSGHGYTKENGWTHPDLAAAAAEKSRSAGDA